MRRLLPLLVVAALSLGGCTAPEAPPRNEVAPSPTPTAAALSPAIGLVGLWRVVGAGDVWLRMTEWSLTVWLECGPISGSWEADDHSFVAATNGGSMRCLEGGGRLPDVPWLEAATSYAPTADGWTLLGASGAVVATLIVDGAPEPDPDTTVELTQPPAVTEQTEAAFRIPAPLPSGFEPGDPAGRWVPVGDYPDGPFVEFGTDGRWTASDGCNETGGRWLATDAGRLLKTTGAMTLIGCEGAPVPGWIFEARTAGFDDELLVLFDTAGAELARFARA